MTLVQQMQSACLCSAVSFRTPVVTHVEACHCGMCRRWGGGPLLSVQVGTDVQIEGEENITVYSSSEWAERAFCRHCGSHLFYRLKSTGQHAIPAGLFEDQSLFEFTEQILVDCKPGYYDFANSTRMLTEHQVFEAFAAQTSAEE